MTDTGDAVEKTWAGALSRGAGEDGMFERLWFQTVAGTGGVGLGGSPGWMRGQVTFSRLSSGVCVQL